MKRFLQRILQEIMKKIILGTSDAWSMSHSSQRPSEPVYYIEDCQSSELITMHAEQTESSPVKLTLYFVTGIPE